MHLDPKFLAEFIVAKLSLDEEKIPAIQGAIGEFFEGSVADIWQRADVMDVFVTNGWVRPDFDTLDIVMGYLEANEIDGISRAKIELAIQTLGFDVPDPKDPFNGGLSRPSESKQAQRRRGARVQAKRKSKPTVPARPKSGAR